MAQSGTTLFKLGLSESLDYTDLFESLSIKVTQLNAFTLDVLGGVRVLWTHNISRHLLLTKNKGRYVVEVFALPCVLESSIDPYAIKGVPYRLAHEIKESYSMLFNAWPTVPFHAKIGRYFGLRRVCPCWACSAYTFQKRVISRLKSTSHAESSRRKWIQDNSPQSEFDVQIVKLMASNEASDWTYERFPSLRSRITLLDEHLQTARPWNIWVLFRDQRDTLQFWTFL
jgi:hypothetical protein